MKLRRHPKGGSVREVITIAVPMVVSMACDTVMTFTDRWFVSALSPDAMNAVFTGGLAAFALETFFGGLISYSTALVAQEFGAKRPIRCVLSTYQALIIALVAWPLLILLLPSAHAIFPRLGLPAAQLVDQIRYFDILVLGSGITLLRGAFSDFFSGIGRTRIVMIASLVSMLTNVGLVWALVFGKLGLPAMGVTGAGVGTVIASALGVVVLAGTFLTKKGARSLGRLPRFRFDRPLFFELVRKGTPAGLEFFLNMLAFQVIVILFERQSEESATAATIMFNWDLVAYVPLVGVEIGVTSLVGRYIGAHHFAAVRRTLRSGIQLGLFFAAAIVFLFVFLPGPLVDVFSSDNDGNAFLNTRSLAVQMVRLASLYVATEVFLLVFSGALRGSGDTFFTLLVSTGTHWCLAIALFITLEAFHLSTFAGWRVYVGAFTLCPLLLVLRWKTGRWRTMTSSSLEPFTPRATESVISS